MGYPNSGYRREHALTSHIPWVHPYHRACSLCDGDDMKHSQDELNTAIHGVHGHIVAAFINHWGHNINNLTSILEGFTIAMALVRLHPEFAAFIARKMNDEHPQSIKENDFASKMADIIAEECPVSQYE